MSFLDAENLISESRLDDHLNQGNGDALHENTQEAYADPHVQPSKRAKVDGSEIISSSTSDQMSVEHQQQQGETNIDNAKFTRNYNASYESENQGESQSDGNLADEGNAQVEGNKTSKEGVQMKTSNRKSHGSYKNLSLKDKLEIIEAVQSKQKTQSQLAKEHGVSRQCIHKIIKSKKRYHGAKEDGRNENLTKVKRVTFPALEARVLQWLHEHQDGQRNSPVPLNVGMAREFAQKEAARLGVPPSEFTASNGWWWRFRRRNEKATEFIRRNPRQGMPRLQRQEKQTGESEKASSLQTVEQIATATQLSKEVSAQQLSETSGAETTTSQNQQSSNPNQDQEMQLREAQRDHHSPSELDPKENHTDNSTSKQTVDNSSKIVEHDSCEESQEQEL